MNIRITTIVTAILAGLAMTTQAKLDETRAEIIKRFSENALTENSEAALTFIGKNKATILFKNGRSVIEVYDVKSKFAKADADDIVHIVIDRHYAWDKLDAKSWQSKDGQFMVRLLEPDPNYTWSIAVGYASQLRNINSTPAPQYAQPRREPVTAGRTPEDCAIIAAQAFSKLKPVTAWCQIIDLQFTNETGGHGHAIVAYKYQTQGNVMLYDADGTLEIQTSATDTGSIMLAFQTRLDAMGASDKIKSMRFITQ
jgi:hypothetical protein